jgi:hypothetical protein
VDSVFACVDPAYNTTLVDGCFLPMFKKDGSGCNPGAVPGGPDLAV